MPIKYDKDFCIHSSTCTNTECYRYLSKQVEEEMGNRPIYVTDYKETEQCDGYVEISKNSP